MRILAITNMYPTPLAPTSGTFVEQQIKGLEQIGLTVDVMLVDRSQEGMRAYWHLKKRVRSRIATYAPDLVHVMYGGVMADEVTCAVRDRPTIVSFCGDDLLGELLSGPTRKLISRYGVWASWRAAKRASAIVVKSKNLEEALPACIDRLRVRIIPNGIALSRFRRMSRSRCRSILEWNPNKFHVLFTDNFGDPRKRPELALAATEVVKGLGIEVVLHTLQRVPHREVPVWLNASDVVLLTSLHEGSPNIIKEALACDIPVVSLDVGDVRERVEGIEGCHIALPSPQDLASKLKLVYAGPRRVCGWSKMQELSIDKVALRLKTLYSESITGFAPRKPSSHLTSALP